MISISRFVVPALLLGLMPLPSLAQVNPSLSDLNDAVEQARTLIQAERKFVVQQNLMMTEDEAEAFWTIYDRYAEDMKKANDLRVKVITDYAANYDDMSDQVANQLLDDGLAFNEEVTKVRKGYLGKFRNVLPAVKVARFYQIENKLDAIAAFALARQIPLVPVATPSAPIAQPPGG